MLNGCKALLRIALERVFPKFYLFYYQQVSADANDGTVDQVSLSNNGTSVGEERTISCVSISFLQNNLKLLNH